MGTSSYSDELKRDAVQQVRVRGYPVCEVSQRLGVISRSLYTSSEKGRIGGVVPFLFEPDFFLFLGDSRREFPTVALPTRARIFGMHQFHGH